VGGQHLPTTPLLVRMKVIEGMVDTGVVIIRKRRRMRGERILRRILLKEGGIITGEEEVIVVMTMMTMMRDMTMIVDAAVITHRDIVDMMKKKIEGMVTVATVEADTLLIITRIKQNILKIYLWKMSWRSWIKR
jgi:hypothetical protein